MNWLPRFFSRRRIYGELSDEIRVHLEEKVEELVAGGMLREEAEHAARREFGNVLRTEERGREVWRWTAIENFWLDVRYALRTLRRTPAVTTVALLSLALGIGANTAIFSLTDTLLLRMLPVRDPGELVEILRHSPRMADDNPVFTNPMWEQVRDRQNAFSGVFAWFPDKFDLANGGQAEYVRGLYASGGYFTSLGVEPLVGRVFTAADDQRGCSGVAVLGYGFWQQHYGGQTSALGSLLRVNGHSFPVIGVTPPGFFGTDVGDRFDVALPICAEAIIHGKDSYLDGRSTWWLRVMARRKPEMSDQQATARMNAIAPGIFASVVPPNWPARQQQIFRKYTFAVRPAGTGLNGFTNVRSQYTRPLEILLAIAGLVLLVACANLASLLLARAAAHRKEFAVRLSLGASRGRLVRQMLTGSLLLALGGAAAGIVVAQWGDSLLVRLVSTAQTRIFLELSPDWRVVGFTIAVAMLTGVLFGILPALRATRISLSAAMKEGREQTGGEPSRFRAGKLVAATQVGLSVVLLAGTGLFVGTFRNLVNVDPGFDPHNVLLARVYLHNANVAEGARAEVYGRMLARLQAMPGVVSASECWFTPFSGMEWNEDITVEGYKAPQGEEPLVWFNWITPGYFSTMRTPLLAGREFTPADTAGSTRVTIVNQTMARRFFPHSNPVGKYFRISEGGDLTSSAPMEIVGVVKDSKYESLREPTLPFAYVPVSQMKMVPESGSFEIRGAVPPASLLGPVRAALGNVNGAAALEFVPLTEQVDDSLGQERMLSLLSTFFGGLALLLTAIGVYGVMAYLVTQRTHDIGVRMALGAPRAAIGKMVVAETLSLVSLGLVAGLACALAATRLVAHTLFELTPYDPLTLALAAGALIAVGALAGYVPARRAMRVDPIMALRNE
ncbi:MAG: ABC transporter permease [Acidobacteriota bacterium]|nr:ABC transporter permease [Acidobacteriota bacterium]